MNAYESYFQYKNSRKKFALKTYLLLLLWLFLAVLQWALICLFDATRHVFGMYYVISFVTFAFAILLFGVFIFWERLRFITILNFFFAFLIVELQIIALFTLAARAFWVDLMVFFLICFLLLWLFILIGSCLPRQIDLTLDVAIIFIVAFIFILVAVFFVIISFVMFDISMIAYIMFEVAVTLIVMFFVMYHAQTILGSRFAEMRLNDALLGSLILFHDFLIIYWLTFYWQILIRPFTPEYWILLSTLQDIDHTVTRSSNMRLLDADDDGYDEDVTRDIVVENEADTDEKEQYQSKDTAQVEPQEEEEAEDSPTKKIKMLIFNKKGVDRNGDRIDNSDENFRVEAPQNGDAEGGLDREENLADSAKGAIVNTGGDRYMKFNRKRVHTYSDEIDHLDENSRVYAPRNEDEQVGSYDGGGLDGGADGLDREHNLAESARGTNIAVENAGEGTNVILKETVPGAREGIKMSGDGRDLPSEAARTVTRIDADGNSMYVTMDGTVDGVGEAKEDVRDSFSIFEESTVGAVEDSPGAPDRTNLDGARGETINGTFSPLNRISAREDEV